MKIEIGVSLNKNKNSVLLIIVYRSLGANTSRVAASRVYPRGLLLRTRLIKKKQTERSQRAEGCLVSSFTFSPASRRPPPPPPAYPAPTPPSLSISLFTTLLLWSELLFPSVFTFYLLTSYILIAFELTIVIDLFISVASRFV